MTTPRAKSGQLMLDPDQLRESGIAVGQKVELKVLPGGGIALVAIDAEFERAVERVFRVHAPTLRKLAE